MKTLLATLALTILAVSVAFAQSVSSSAKVGKAAKGVVPVTVTIQIPSGYHIYGPKAGSAGIATAIKVKGTDFKLGAIKYPKTKTIEIGGEKFEVYEQKVSVPVTISRAKKMAGKQKVHLLITTQACNDRTCLPPSTVDLPVTVNFG